MQNGIRQIYSKLLYNHPFICAPLKRSLHFNVCIQFTGSAVFSLAINAYVIRTWQYAMVLHVHRTLFCRLIVQHIYCRMTKICSSIKIHCDETNERCAKRMTSADMVPARRIGWTQPIVYDTISFKYLLEKFYTFEKAMPKFSFARPNDGEISLVLCIILFANHLSIQLSMVFFVCFRWCGDCCDHCGGVQKNNLHFFAMKMTQNR